VEESGPVFLDEDPHAPRAQPGPAGVPAQPGAGQGGRGRSVEESGPMFLDEDPHAPRAQTGPSVGAARGSGDAPEWPRMDRPGTELPRISWGTDASRAPAAGQQAGAGGPALPAQAQPPASDAAFRSLPAQAGPGGSHTGTPSPGPQGPGLQPPRAAAPGAAVPGQAVPDRAEPAFRAPQAEGQGAGWAAQVQGLAREGGEVPWRPVASDPFGASRGHDRPGGLVRRFAARVIDGVVLGALTAAAAVPLGAAAYHHARDKVDQAKLTGETVRVWLLDGTTGAELGAVAVVFLLAGLLLEVLPTARWGRTLGKKLVGLRVLDIEAQLPPGFGASLRRWLARTVLNAVVVGVVGAAWCLFDRPWKQCWHDKAARTFVAEV
jgi:uncharacterized RDD family membrane protein YckC